VVTEKSCLTIRNILQIWGGENLGGISRILFRLNALKATCQRLRPSNGTKKTSILNMGITWISWGAAPGYINIAPKGLEDNYLSYFCFPKTPVCSLLEYSIDT
jgi:hypothetical protein